ncbi:hypothetical protein HY404_03180 [Candidatus Microgenomates bacterium]|nr:hypothetical protein [Candidatus Microgenomates bacterium]
MKISLFLIFSGLIWLGFWLGLNVGKISSFVRSPRLPAIYLPSAGENMTPKQLQEALSNKNFTFINVHTPYEGEIAKTDLFINFDEMQANEKLLPQDKNTAIVLYCKTGNMSGQALSTLKKMGYTNVRHLAGGMDSWQKNGQAVLDLSKLTEQVLPKDGVTLPVNWGGLGPKLVAAGVIDLDKFTKATKLTDEQKKILSQGGEMPIKIDNSNSHFVVNVLWALGLAQKSLVYDEGPLGKEYKNKAGNFASTGGWTLAKGTATNYLNKFDLIPLTGDQQKKVGEIAKNIYRPCCGNPTWFPDCNHGMAALAVIELLVSQNLSESEIYKYILGFNSFWFPDNYLTAATYFARQGTKWDQVDAKRVLSAEFSSAKGASEVAKKVGPLPYANISGGSCGA